jgi:hypothetical protein
VIPVASGHFYASWCWVTRKGEGQLPSPSTKRDSCANKPVIMLTGMPCQG